ncbi:pyocin activator PrtN family protein [Dyella sp. S184]|uniref:pyocin activator PrtN family protein n=1 Tax=Dyella sp. S184 TaxID=1641862 RepID=UPI00131AE5C3|nr:pyocin activator PrtN family protein [Dyella sp. S184]
MNTLFALMAEYETSQIPLSKCAHLFGLTAEEANKRANRHALPLPAYRAGTQKSPYIVDARSLAEYLDDRKNAAKAEWAKLQAV